MSIGPVSGNVEWQQEGGDRQQELQAAGAHNAFMEAVATGTSHDIYEAEEAAENLGDAILAGGDVAGAIVQAFDAYNAKTGKTLDPNAIGVFAEKLGWSGEQLTGLENRLQALAARHTKT